MSNPMLQLLVLGAIAIFLIVRLKNVLGTRDGFERPLPPPDAVRIIDTAVPDAHDTAHDSDIADHAPQDGSATPALEAMKQAEPSFALGPFLNGAKGAYEMILTAFERGDLSDVRGFLAPQVAQAFQQVIDTRHQNGLTVEATFLGVRETQLLAARFDPASQLAELTVRLTGEMISATRDASGAVVDGDPKAAQKQRDVWTFARTMGSADPNWQLVATSV